MLSITDILKRNGAVVKDGYVTIRCIDIDKAMNEYRHCSALCELQDLIKSNSTQAYWPAIIKQRINQLNGNGR